MVQSAGYILSCRETHGIANRFAYDYYGAGSRTWRENVVSGGLAEPVWLDEFYVYDGLARLVNTQRGQLNAGRDGIEGEPGDLIARYGYDASGRRAFKAVAVYDGQGELTGYDRTDFYYNESWQVLEERAGFVESAETLADTPAVQWLWDRRYIDAPVLRWRDANADSGQQGSDGLEETLYYLTDANMNVTGLADSSGQVVERYVYDAYGRVTFYEPDWSDTPAESALANTVLYAGYRFDAETGLFHVRNRYYDPALGRWITRDPAGYADGMSLYAYASQRPTVATDPMGTDLILTTELGVLGGQAPAAPFPETPLSLDWGVGLAPAPASPLSDIPDSASAALFMEATLLMVEHEGDLAAERWLASSFLLDSGLSSDLGSIARGMGILLDPRFASAFALPSGWLLSQLVGEFDPDPLRIHSISLGDSPDAAFWQIAMGDQVRAHNRAVELLNRDAADAVLLRGFNRDWGYRYVEGESTIHPAASTRSLMLQGTALLVGGPALRLGASAAWHGGKALVSTAVARASSAAAPITARLAPLTVPLIQRAQRLWNWANYQLGRLMTGGNAVSGTSSKILQISSRDLQKVFMKHGADLGLTGSWNASRAAEVSRLINAHVNDPAVRAISGTYRGGQVIHYLNPQTALNVIATRSGTFVGAWKLSIGQLRSVLTNGRLF